MKARYILSCAVAAILSGGAGGAMAADAASTAADAGVSSAAVEELIVTAERRDESVQSVPMTLQAFSGAALANRNITTFDDLLRFTPNITFAKNGPGQGNIFMRGLSAGFAGNQSSATVGNFPNVAVYLDEQSMQFPARNVDLYYADISRVEVLEGPQGTLFGGGAEAGAVRYITNKPKMNTYEGSVDASYGVQSHGDPSTSFVAVINIPLITDRLAVRGVIYSDHQGGYIDNVASTFTRSNNDSNVYFGIKPTNGICPNGQPAGKQTGGCTIPGAAIANNFALAEKNYNPVSHEGARLSVLYDFNNDWDVLITESLQNMDAEGMSSTLPVGSDFQPLKPLQTTRLHPDLRQGPLHQFGVDFERQGWRPEADLYRRLHDPSHQPADGLHELFPHALRAILRVHRRHGGPDRQGHAADLQLTGHQLARPGAQHAHEPRDPPEHP